MRTCTEGQSGCVAVVLNLKHTGVHAVGAKGVISSRGEERRDVTHQFHERPVQEVGATTSTTRRARTTGSTTLCSQCDYGGFSITERHQCQQSLKPRRLGARARVRCLQSCHVAYFVTSKIRRTRCFHHGAPVLCGQGIVNSTAYRHTTYPLPLSP